MEANALQAPPITAARCGEVMRTLFLKIANQRSDAWNLDPYRWDWSAGVALFGLAEAADALGDPAIEAFLEAWFERAAAGRRLGSVNHVCPANAVLRLALRTGKPEAEAVCTEYADWCMGAALRTSSGGWAHVWEGGDPDYRHQLWIDTVFMAVVFLARLGTVRGDAALIGEARRQLELHLECLHDPSTGLFYHAHHCGTGRSLGEHWGRGNGWMVASLAELLALLPTAGEGLGRAHSRFRAAMEAAHARRAEGGLLRTLPLVPEAYPETTGSALFAYAALRGWEQGLLDGRFLAWGLQLAGTVASGVDAAGAVAQCSYGTNPEARSVYLGLPYCQSLYADGIVLMLLSRARRMLE